MSLASLIGIDKERYDAGNKFLSQDPYLQNFQARDPITFNVSPSRNMGIMNPLLYAGDQRDYDDDNDDITTTNTPFNQVENLFPTPPEGLVPGMDIPAINFKDAPVDFKLRENNPAVFDPVVNIKNAIQSNLKNVRDFGLKGLTANMLSQGGAKAGFNVLGLPGALAGMLGGAKLGLEARGPTVAEQVVANFYGNQGNTPGFYVDPDTGELVQSAMQGYNISSAYGQGIPAAIQKRIDKITKTINRPGYTGTLDKPGGLLEKLKKEQAALESSQEDQAKNLQDYNRATRQGGYQSNFAQDTSFMEGPPGREPFSGDTDLSGTMGST
tara:strand:- start:52 stop:1029 length:978 start_codon:yes stop_codon:yes gene_type:complete